MKIIKLLLLLGTLSSFTVINPASAQIPATLGGQLYMGLSITGTVGTVYAIQATTNAAQTNGWTCLAFIQLPTANYLWLDSSAPAAGRRFYRAVTTAPKNLVFIPPGTFRMGSPTNEVGRFVNEGPQTEVTLTKGFYMGKYEVTQGDYLAVIGSDPSYFTGDTNRPVETVTWSDATNYCAQRSQQELAAGRIPAGSQYRLPTEAEWEYAGRAWTSTRFYHGDDLGDTNLTNYAWHGNNSDGITQAVGQKLPNAWGLYDMAGNVWEWCQDRYGPYPGGRVTDPQGPGAGLFSVVRGGSWISFAGDCRSAGRFSLNPAFADFDFGFRVVLAPGP